MDPKGYDLSRPLYKAEASDSSWRQSCFARCIVLTSVEGRASEIATQARGQGGKRHLLLVHGCIVKKTPPQLTACRIEEIASPSDGRCVEWTFTPLHDGIKTILHQDNLASRQSSPQPTPMSSLRHQTLGPGPSLSELARHSTVAPGVFRYPLQTTRHDFGEWNVGTPSANRHLQLLQLVQVLLGEEVRP